MRRQREKERLASEAYIKKLHLDEEEQKKMLQLAQDQLFARTLAKEEIENARNRRERFTRFNLNNQTKSKTSSAKSTVKTTKISADKKNVVASKNKSNSYNVTLKCDKQNYLKTQKKTSPKSVVSQKPVPIHNAVTRVVTHQNQNKSTCKQNNSTLSTASHELIGSSSKIYGQQSEEELHVPNDVLNNKKKKLGVEVCMTTVNVDDEERTGSAESSGSHDSMNQEFHHFKPIKALPRTSFKTLDGKQVEPKLIRVIPKLKKVVNIVPKAPIPTLTKKVLGCARSAFKKITKQKMLIKDSPSQQQREIKKTEMPLQTHYKSIIEDSNSADGDVLVSVDDNKNYTKNLCNKVVNGAKLNKNEMLLNNDKLTDKRAKVRNGFISVTYKKKEPKKEIEVVQIDDDDDDDDKNNHDHNDNKKDEHINVDTTDDSTRQQTPDPLGPSPNKLVDGLPPRPSSLMLEFAAIENIAERIKRRKAAVTTNVQSIVDTIKPTVERSVKTKNSSKSSSAKSNKTKVKKPNDLKSNKSSKTKKKTVETTVSSQIKRLARAKKSSAMQKFEDSESDEEIFSIERKTSEFVIKSINNDNQKPNIDPMVVCSDDNDNDIIKSTNVNVKSSPSPRKRPRKNAHPSKKQKSTVVESSPETLIYLESQSFVNEQQEHLERLAEQERKDRELAEELQARFDAMERIAGRTRRGVALLPESSSFGVVAEQRKRPSQKRSVVK